MERYCPNEGCSADLTATASKAENWISSPGKMFEGVFCLGCGQVVMPTATRDLYWKSKA